jgi:hypothetical protein
VALHRRRKRASEPAEPAGGIQAAADIFRDFAEGKIIAAEASERGRRNVEQTRKNLTAAGGPEEKV